MRWAPVILLVLIALHHRWRIYRRRQTSWKGGGFSMFSEVRRNSVVTEIWINDRNQGLCPLLAVDHRDNFLLKSAEAIPTEKHILAWAKWVADAEWIRCGKFAHRPFGLQDGNPLAIAKVVARFRQLDFDSKSGTHSAEEIIIHNVEPGKEASKVAT